MTDQHEGRDWLDRLGTYGLLLLGPRQRGPKAVAEPGTGTPATARLFALVHLLLIGGMFGSLSGQPACVKKGRCRGSEDVTDYNLECFKYHVSFFLWCDLFFTSPLRQLNKHLTHAQGRPRG